MGFALTPDAPFAKVLGKGLPQTDISRDECPYPLLNKQVARKMQPKGTSTKDNYKAVTYFDSNLMLLSKRKCAVNKQRSIHATIKWHVTLAEDVLKSF